MLRAVGPVVAYTQQISDRSLSDEPRFYCLMDTLRGDRLMDKNCDDRAAWHQRPAFSAAMRVVLVSATATVMAGFGVPGIAQSQDTSAGQLEEVIVTASRREQKLEEVPISVAAYTQEKMDVQGIRDIGDIAAYTPSLAYSATDGLRTLNNRISIRGVSSTVGGATTGIYFDDTPIAIRTLRTNGDPSATPFPQLFDVERVEVLRGPQGTLFGSGSEGGTVRFITPEPSLSGGSVYGRVGASTTKYGAASWEAGVAGGAPLIEDRLGFRLSISTSRTGGYIDHGDYYTGQIDDDNYNWQKSFTLRAALKWLVTDQLTISPSYFHQQINVNGGSGFYLPDNTAGVNTADPAYIAYYQRYGGQFSNFGHFGDGAGHGDYVSAEGSIGSSKQYMDLYAVNFKYSLPKVDFIYNPSIYKNRQDNVSDFTFLSFNIFPFWTAVVDFNVVPPVLYFPSPVYFPSNPAARSPEYDNQDNTATTHEFRVQSADPDARIHWVAGLFYFDQKLYSHSAIDNSTWGLILPDAISPAQMNDPAYGPISWGCDMNNMAACHPPWLFFYQNRYGVWLDTWARNKEKAIFGQADIDITKHLTATIGLRYSKMEFQSILFSAGALDGPGTTEDNTSKMNLTTPKFGLQWTFEEGKMVYATAAKGGRNGGVNQTISDPACLDRLRDVWGMPNGAPKYYEGDTVWSYELGGKFRAFQDRFSVDAAVYQIDWDDIIRSVEIGGDQCIFSYTTNLGKAQSRGAELSIQYLPIDSLSLTAAFGYAKVQSASTIYVPDPNEPDGIARTPDGKLRYITRDGAILPGSNTTLTLGAQYSFTAFTRPSYARADFRYVGTPTKGDSWDPNSSQYEGQYELFETPKLKTVNVRLGTQLSDWDVSVFVNNLANTQPISRFRMGNITNYSGAWMTGGVMTRPREMGVTAVYRY
ncbi:MAG: TonB-dependent receptor [Gammaproteobacteria bacterium]|nr:TonB-dependent receptor [Gammaproteobacteria bacterium]